MDICKSRLFFYQSYRDMISEPNKYQYRTNKWSINFKQAHPIFGCNDRE